MASHGDTRIHRTLGVLLFSFLLFASVAWGQTTLDSITVNPTSVNVAGGAQDVTVTMHLRNSAGGLTYVLVYLGDPNSSSILGLGSLTAGTATNGTWTAHVSVQPSTPPGTYPVVLQVFDAGFNLEVINTSKSVQVSGGDSQAPTLSGTPVVNPTSVDVTAGQQTVTVDFDLLDNSSGILYASAEFLRGDTAGMASATATLVSGDNLNGSWQATVVIPQSANGVLNLRISAFDNAFNALDTNSGVTLTVTGGDNVPPSLSGTPVVTPASVDLTGGPKTVNVDFDLLDNSSGILYATAEFFRGDTLSIASGMATLISGDNLNGSWQAAVEIPQWANGALNLRISAMDNASNSLDTNLGVILTATGGDTVLPSVSGTPVAAPLVVNVGGGDQVGKLTLTATDTYTGISNIYTWFADSSGQQTGYSYGSTLVSGDSLIGVWELDTHFGVDDSAGAYHLFVSLTDAAGNSSETEFPGVIVTVTRAPEARVTFRMDSRRLERLGLLLRKNESPRVRIFGGMNDGEYVLSDPEADSVWVDSVVVQAGQTITYAFGLPGPSGAVHELGGESGGRSLSVTSTDPVILPVVAYDNLPPVGVDPSTDAVVKYEFSAGDPYVHEFTDDTVRTFVSIDFNPIGGDLIASVRRYSHSGGGTAPGGITTVAPNLYWGFASAPAAVVFNAKLIFQYDFFGGVSDPSALRLLKRTGAGQPWQVVPTTLNSENGRSDPRARRTRSFRRRPDPPALPIPRTAAWASAFTRRSRGCPAPGPTGTISISGAPPVRHHPCRRSGA
jgi:hypothetical protein